jgi:ATP-dependent Clp protease protease subunit
MPQKIIKNIIYNYFSINIKMSKEDIHVELVSNILYLYGEINTNLAFKINKIINDENMKIQEIKNPFIASVNYKPMYLMINSYGGFLSDAMSIIDTIKSSKIPIYTVVDGFAASCASLIAVCGKKRFIKPMSSVLIHQLHGSVRGKYNDICDHKHQCDMYMQQIEQIYIENSKMSLQQVKDKLMHESFILANECITLGLADELYK